MTREKIVQGILIRARMFCFTFGPLILFNGCMFAWVLRDGLGPDSYESYGFNALSHFLSLFTPCAIAGLFLLLLGYSIGRKISSSPSRNKSTEIQI
jgi:hypothetical protein